MTDAHIFYQESGLHVEVYDTLTELHGGVITGDVDFYLQKARRIGGPVLELGVGTGRVAWALARAGLEVVGLDTSQPMLAQAEAKRAQMTTLAQPLARFVRANMADFDLDRTFTLVLCAYRSFQALTSPEDQRRALQSVYRHLRSGGYFIVNLFDPRLDWCTPNAIRESVDSSVRHPITNNLVKVEVVNRRNDTFNQLFTECWRFTEIGAAGQVLRQEEEVLTLRWTYRQEMRYLFELVGFEVEAEYSDFHQSPPAYAREQVWVVRRP